MHLQIVVKEGYTFNTYESYAILGRMKKRALLSVRNREGLVDLACFLQEEQYELLLTEGTRAFLKEQGIIGKSVEDVTHFPPCFGGRLKTLHPLLLGGILMRPQDREEAERLGVEPIGLVCVSLYPFEERMKGTEGTQGTDGTEVEFIDIGGVALLRAAAKNYEYVTVLCDPHDYPRVVAELRRNGETSRGLRRELAAKAFLRCAAYDATISKWMSNGAHHGLILTKGRRLRYGENPHQWGKVYALGSGLGVGLGGVANAEILQGKEMSYLNYLDADAAWQCVIDFKEPTAVFLKHTSPCGVASNTSILEAFRRGYDSDPRSAFGVIIALNCACPTKIVKEIIDRKIFVELLIAPNFAEAARELLKNRPNVRVLKVQATTPRDAPPRHGEDVRLSSSKPEPCGGAPQGDVEYHSISGGVLVQSLDTRVVTEADLEAVSVVKPSKEQVRDLLFAARVVKHTKSNAVVLAKDKVTIGIGPGQTSRVDATEIAVRKAGLRAKEAVMASDAFLPFPDALEVAAAAGVTAIIQPGGSIRDKEVIARADERGIAMVFTGVRAFRH